jgi:hypothetical protein
MPIKKLASESLVNCCPKKNHGWEEKETQDSSISSGVPFPKKKCRKNKEISREKQKVVQRKVEEKVEEKEKSRSKEK